jgi:hypothetical protein
MKILIALILSTTSSFASTTPANPIVPDNCLTTREFVTALEFLRADEDFRLKEPEGRELAFKIAEGCTGSAKRFIRIAKTLTKAGANRKNATETGLQFSSGTDAETDAFNSAFRKALAEDGLDLDFASSLKIALSLSKEFAGDLEKVRKDFEKIVDYCADSSTLALPRSQCGAYAASIARKGEPWKEGIADSFIKAFQYLRSESGPTLVTKDALQIAELLVTQGPGAPENFKQAYQYGSSTAGLALPRDEAIQFAKKMAAITKAETKTEGLKASPAKVKR